MGYFGCLWNVYKFNKVKNKCHDEYLSHCSGRNFSLEKCGDYHERMKSNSIDGAIWNCAKLRDPSRFAKVIKSCSQSSLNHIFKRPISYNYSSSSPPDTKASFSLTGGKTIPKYSFIRNFHDYDSDPVSAIHLPKRINRYNDDHDFGLKSIWEKSLNHSALDHDQIRPSYDAFKNSGGSHNFEPRLPCSYDALNNSALDHDQIRPSYDAFKNSALDHDQIRPSYDAFKNSGGSHNFEPSLPIHRMWGTAHDPLGSLSSHAFRK